MSFESTRIEAPPPEAWSGARRAALKLAQPLERFLRIQAASGILLLIAAVIAMVWANSRWADAYHALWHTPVGVVFGPIDLRKDLHFWINEGLMVIFFFVVGLEIRREIHEGELSELKRAALPIAAALGGMLVPAGIYLALNRTPETHSGWGVPMATDIAFAVGILALLGKRVPAALRVLLLALAIIDDIGAIVVIALFYSSGIKLSGILIAAAGVGGAFLLKRIGVRRVGAYIAPGVVVWAGLLLSGIHPTIAGVIMGLLTPVRSWFGEEGFLEQASEAVREFRERAMRSHDTHELLEPLARIDMARREAVPPVVRLEAALNPWVAFGVMPIFALANAGVTLGATDFGAAGATLVAAGVALGLALGKPIGILLTSLLAVRLGIAALPRGVDARGIFVVGCVGGIGFTMALFIAELAFRDPVYLGVAKLAVLVGSAAAGILGVAAGALLLRPPQGDVVAMTVHEAERSTEM
jgi:Na+:H+ antiporter, NhaA family